MMVVTHLERKRNNEVDLVTMYQSTLLPYRFFFFVVNDLLSMV